MSPGHAIIALWLAFAASWLAAAFWTNPTERSLGLKEQIGYRFVLVAGGAVFAVPAHGYEGSLRLWHVNLVEAWTCVGLIAAGFAFAWWARIYLGKTWSGHITKKVDHEVIEGGPYRIVRHPIYTGILIAILATTAAKGSVLGIAGAALITLGLWMKARLEERWLSHELAGSAYASYCARTPMLIPQPWLLF